MDEVNKSDYYREEMFVGRGNLQKYQCIHCRKISKKFYRCKCAIKPPGTPGTGRSIRYDDNAGLSCASCKDKLCSMCNRADQYERDSVTDQNIKNLKVTCTKSCGEKLLLRDLEKHLKEECPRVGSMFNGERPEKLGNHVGNIEQLSTSSTNQSEDRGTPQATEVRHMHTYKHNYYILN